MGPRSICIAWLLCVCAPLNFISVEPSIAQAQTIAALTTAIPFTICRNLICFQALINGKGPYTLVLDTGNPSSVVDTQLARALQLPLSPYVSRRGTTLPNVFRTSASVTLGNLTLPISDAIALDTTSAFKGEDRHVDGTLAYGLFKDRLLQIDYAKGVLRTSAPLVASWACAAHCGQIKLITFGKSGPPIVTGYPFEINGKPVVAQIDTAFEGTMVLYPNAVDALHLHSLEKRAAPRFFPFSDGGVTMLAKATESLGFADQPLGSDRPTVYLTTKGVHLPDALFDATVGNELFKGAVLTLDFHDMIMSVELDR